MPELLTLATDVEVEFTEKKSRFITRLHRVTSTEQSDALFRAARAQHPNARHHCTALIISDGFENTSPIHRSNDDGEPAGTAGLPMLIALQQAHLVDVAAIVIRYFGGVKLGAGGLVRAYTAGVEQAVGAASLLRRTELAVAELDVSFAEAGVAENAVRMWAEAHGASVAPTVYGAAGATLHVLLAPERMGGFAEDVAAWSQGRLVPREAGRRIADIPVGS